MTTHPRRPEIFRLLVKVPEGFPDAPAMDSFLVELDAPDPLGPTREEIVAAVDEATLPGERVLDEKWSEYDWRATGLSSLIFDAAIAYGLTKGLDALVVWIKANMKQTWTKVETEEDAVAKVRVPLTEVHDAKEVDVESVRQVGTGHWELVVRSGKHTFDVVVESEHYSLGFSDVNVKVVDMGPKAPTDRPRYDQPF